MLLIQWRTWAAGSTHQPPRIASVRSTSQPAPQQAPVRTDEATSGQIQPVLASVSSENSPSTESSPATVSQSPSSSTPWKPENQAEESVSATSNTSNTQVVVNLSARRVSVYSGNKLKASYPLAVGQAGWETPTGTFQVTEMQQDPQWLHPITKEVVPPGPSNPLGKRWIGFWSDGRTHIGFHGTNQEQLIGQAVSHGCLRMRNRDVMALYNQVQEGTPVIVRK